MKEINNNNDNNEFYLASWLAGDLSDKELKNLVSEVDFNAYHKLKNSFQSLDVLAEPLPNSLETIQRKINVLKQQKKKRKNFRWGIAIAASFLVLFGLFSTFSNPVIKMETANTEQKSFHLLDGSEVVLNATSQLSYQEKDWDSKRMVKLTGEAFFKVEKGSKFTVNTSLGNIMVLGTQFNVKADDDYFQVTCFEGKVKVIQGDEEFILNPNDSFRKINGNAVEELNTSHSSPSWVNGESTFKSVPLKYVILALEKQYNIEIDAIDIDDTLIFTGSFSHKNLEIALASVFKTMNINYKKKERGIYRLD